jgi:hypothetical protein
VKLTAKQVEDKIKLHSPHISLDYDTYTNTNIRARFFDEKYGEWWSKPWRVTSKRSQHPKRKNKIKLNRTPQDVETEIQEKHKFVSLDYSTFVNCKTKARFVDSEYGEWWSLPSSVLAGCLNPKRSGNERISTGEVEKRAQACIPGIRLKYDTYKNTSTKACFIDPVHGEWWVVPYHLLAGHKHPKNYNNIPVSANELNKKLLVRYPHIQVDPNTYTNMYKRAQFIDVEFGEWWANPFNIVRGHGHPHRFPTAPGLEKILSQIINTPVYNKTPNFLSNVKNIKPDFMINNNIYVEADGLYWHSELITKDKYHHYRRELFQKYGKRLVQLREDEIRNKPKIIKSMFDSILLKNKRVYARKCIITNEVPNSFFEENHLMGSAYTKACGLLFNSQLVCSISYVIRNNKLHIIRFCSILNVNVVGGFSKLLNHIISVNNFKGQVVNLVDLRYGNGNYLLKFGFILESISLGWRWTDFKKTYSRLKHIAVKKKWYKIFDAGQAKYTKVIR